MEGKGLGKLKGIVHFQMKITPSFTHPQAILGVYDFLLSDEHNQRNINKYPDASELYNGSEESASIHIHPSYTCTHSEAKRCVCVKKKSIFKQVMK